MRESARRSGGFAIRRQKRLDLFIADLQSAAVGFSCLLCAFSLEADCKSALNRSSLFCLRIANPQGRLAGLRLTLSPGGVASHPFAWRGCVSPFRLAGVVSLPFRLAGLRLSLSPSGVASLPFAWRGCVSPLRLAGLRLSLSPGGVASLPCAWRGCVSPFTPCQPGIIPTAGGGSCD